MKGQGTWSEESLPEREPEVVVQQRHEAVVWLGVLVGFIAVCAFCGIAGAWAYSAL